MGAAALSDRARERTVETSSSAAAWRTATGPITLNEELVDYRLVEPAHCTAWRAGTGFALRDWLRSRGFEPRMTDRPGDGDIEEGR